MSPYGKGMEPSPGGQTTTQTPQAKDRTMTAYQTTDTALLDHDDIDQWRSGDAFTITEEAHRSGFYNHLTFPATVEAIGYAEEDPNDYWLLFRDQLGRTHYVVGIDAQPYIPEPSPGGHERYRAVLTERQATLPVWAIFRRFWVDMELLRLSTGKDSL